MPSFKADDGRQPEGVKIEDELEPPVKWHEQWWNAMQWFFEMGALTVSVAVTGFVTVLLLKSFATMLIKILGDFWIALFVGVIILGLLIQGFFWTLHKVLKGSRRDPTQGEGDHSHAR